MTGKTVCMVPNVEYSLHVCVNDWEPVGKRSLLYYITAILCTTYHIHPYTLFLSLFSYKLFSSSSHYLSACYISS